MAPKRKPDPPKPWEAAWWELQAHPLFAPLCQRARCEADEDGPLLTVGAGRLLFRPDRRVPEAHWRFLFAHGLCHLGFDQHPADLAGNVAACRSVNLLLASLKIAPGVPADTLPLPTGEERVAALLRQRPDLLDAALLHCPTEGGDLLRSLPDRPGWRTDFTVCFAEGLQAAVEAAVDVAGGARVSLSAQAGAKSPWQLAWSWTISRFPLLGGVAAAMSLVEDAEVCRALDIATAAVDPQRREVYVNPTVRLTADERRFVVAHELLHAALLHDRRVDGRDPWLWNVAADFAINAWLVMLGVGSLPEGCLYDPELVDLSSEAIYDRIANDLRRFRKLASLRGVGVGDVLGASLGNPGIGTNLDDFYRGALASGVELWRRTGRGTIPAGLEAEIRAAAAPPVPWDVKLASWFDEWFPPVFPERSFARLSRRQSAAPHIPMPGRRWREELVRSRTFALVLDTSGSMPVPLLARILGTIGSYCAERDVGRVRVVCCDAAAYDLGYVPVDDLASRLTIKGRGGTELQPAVDLLERADDFPADGPVLLATDTEIGYVKVRREHAWLVPKSRRLPFNTHAPIFYVD